jgi:hypothetical protein
MGLLAGSARSRAEIAAELGHKGISGQLNKVDIDAELSALEARRDKTRRLKQGTMQELLTGRTRLV